MGNLDSADLTGDPANLTSKDELRQAVVRLTYARSDVRAAAKEIGLAKTTISALRNGRNLTLGSLTAIVTTYRPDELAAWIAAWKRLNGAQVAPDGSAAALLVPRQLPRPTTPFVGRTAETAELTRLATPQPGSAVVVCVVGMGGLGKTELVVQWAQALDDRFPDGILFMDLRGYDQQPPVNPTDALRTLLYDLGETTDIPPTRRDREARYRTLVAGRRMLLIFDNVRDAEQVQPLIPAAETCVAIVTSRDDLTALRALHGTRRLTLGPLPSAAARQLFDNVAGIEAAGSPVLAELVEWCSGYPLALRIAGGQAAGRALSMVEQMVRDLVTETGPLEVFRAGTGRADLRDVVSWSYQNLDDGAARAFRLLAAHPGSIFDPYAVAALTATSVLNARRWLETLRHANLIHDRSGTHFGMHDLLRDYSRDVGGSAERAVALERLLGHYLAGARAARAVLYPNRLVAEPAAALASSPLPAFASVGAAREWLDRERPNLVAAVAEAARVGDAEHACLIANALWLYLHESGHYLAAVAMHGYAAEAARAAERWTDLAVALDHLGIAHQLVGDYPSGLQDLTEALDLHRICEERQSEGRTHSHLGALYARQARYPEAVAHLRAGLEIAEEVGDRVGAGNAVNNLGLSYQRWGRHRDALVTLNRAIQLAEQARNTAMKAIALNNRGLVHQRLWLYAEARRDVDEALTISRTAGLRSVAAEALDTLGTLLVTTGQTADAQDPLNEALAIHRDREVGDRAAEGLTLHHIGQLRFARGEYVEALGLQNEALRIAREVGEHGLETTVHIAAGSVLRALGRFGQAAEHYTAALELARQVGNRDDQATALVGAGHVAAQTGARIKAREHWKTALQIYHELSLPDAVAVRHLLNER